MAQNTYPWASSGNVGIGTTSPASQLQVNAISGAPAIAVSASNSITSGTRGDYAWYNSSLSTVANIRGEATTDNVGTHLDFYTRPIEGSLTQMVRFASDGKVGIGTSSPLARLNILDPVKNNTSIVIARGVQGGQADLPNTYGYPYLRIGGIEYDNNYTNLSKQTIGFGYFPGGYSPVEIGVEITNWASSGIADIVLATRSDGSNTIPLERMRINSSGNVGIGTASPSEKLSVNGKIRAKEIKVETGWADFVFQPDYKLRSLKETEQFIEQNGHLPEIPSAKDVEENGINLGEMNAKLLQKIEELTLHLIEQSKRSDIQERLIEEQQKEINHLRPKL